MKVQPYLFFNGRCQEALDFYRNALGAEIGGKMKYKESPDPSAIPPGGAEMIMHSSFRVGETELMASDGCGQGQLAFQGISLTLSAPDAAKAEQLFDALSDGGQVQMPLVETFFSPKFGMVADKFGVSWMVIVDVPDPAQLEREAAHSA